MALPIPNSPHDITPDWLSKALSGKYGPGMVRVREVEIVAGTKWNVADTAFLSVAYEDAAATLPEALFVKIRQEPDPLASIFPGEQQFYKDAKDAALPIAPCLASLVDEESGATCIVLEDLSETHEASAWPLPPALARCSMALRSLAGIHAHWQ